MWTRKELKQSAKNGLQTVYWKAFLVSVILVFVGGGGGCSNLVYDAGSTGVDIILNSEDYGFGYNEYDYDYETDYYIETEPFGWADMDWSFLLEPLFIILMAIILFIMLIGLALRIFLLSPLEVGSTRYFKQAGGQA